MADLIFFRTVGDLRREVDIATPARLRYRITLGPRKLEQEVSISPGSPAAAPARYRRSAGHSSGTQGY